MSGTPLAVRAEGLAERLGDVVLGCSGGAPGLVVTGNLTVQLNVPITNRLSAGTPGDIILTVDTGSGQVPVNLIAEQLQTAQVVSLNGFSFTIPPSGNLTVRISNLRGSVVNAPLGQVVIATLALNNLSTMTLINNSPVVGVAQRGLLTNSSSTTIRCFGSPVPGTVSMTNLFLSGTHFESTRLTEGFASAFQPRAAQDDAGTRFIIRYTNIPAGIMLFVPDFIAGSDALQPTAGGDLGTPQGLGNYASGSKTLLLARVNGADSTGRGGLPLTSGTFDQATQLPISAGSTYVVYEVLDANSSVLESAQFPTFVGTATSGVGTGTANEFVSFAPTSTDNTANSSAPIPRFIATTPPSDCQSIGDCGADYFPAMAVFAQDITFTAIQGGLPLQPPGYIAIQNPNGSRSVLNWVATVKYQNGADWLTLENPFGLNNGSVRVWAKSQNLAPGTYSAWVVIDGGTAGTKVVPVTLVVAPFPPTTTPPVTTPANNPAVTSVTNGANYLAGPVVSGSIAAIRGSKFTGKAVSVTFDGTDAKVLNMSDGQINVLVPDGMGAKTSAQVVVTVDGLSSTAMTVPLAFAAPAICDKCVLNQDFSINTATSGDPVSNVLHIYLTGLPASGGTVTVKLHDRDGLTPVIYGPADGLPGLQYVDVMVPGDLPAISTTASVCVLDIGSVRTCSAAAPVTLTAPATAQEP